MKYILTILLLLNVAYGQLTTIGTRNAYVYDPKVKAPLILAFHGNGEGTNLLANGFPQLLNSGWKPPKAAYIICPQERWGTFPVSEIPQLIKNIKAKYQLVDTTQVYYTGYSAGGVTAFNGISVWKPKATIPLSSASNDNNLVNLYAQTQIPVHLVVGNNETSYRDISGWTAYLLGQAKANYSYTIRPNIGHCCWNDTYKSEWFWEQIKTTTPVKQKKDTTVNNLNPFVLPPGTWTVKTTTARAGTYAIQSGRLVTMSEGVFVLDGDFEYTITFKKPPAVEPVQCMVITIDKKKTILYTHPEKNFYKGLAYDMTIECDGKKLTLKKDFTWQIN